ncbi:MAG: hypothetical protein M3O28_15525 [Actinomycetota bacterium]|nr:hypothetical protein [Actinomycetota bacterium]
MPEPTVMPGFIAGPTLSQFYVTCPTCRRSCAVHVNESGNDGAVIVRVVCPELCTADLGALADILAIRYAVGALSPNRVSCAVA